MSRAVSSGGGRALGPTPGDRGASRQSQTQHPVAPPARGGRGKELTAGALRPRADREAPGSRPALLGPDGRCPRTPAAALNSLLLQSSGGGGGGGGGSGQNNHCECVKAAGGEGGQGVGMVHALGSSGGRKGSCWARWRLPHAARRGCELRRFVSMVRGWCLNQ